MDHLLPLLETLPARYHPMFVDAIAGDELAVLGVLDLVEEEGIRVNPFVVGQGVYIETQTLYYVGLIAEISSCWVRLKNASWVHRTGRKSKLFKNKSFEAKQFSANELKPRTEYLGDWTVAIGCITGFADWPVKNLPMEAIQ